MVSRLRQRGYQLQVRDVLRHPVLSDLSKLISSVSRQIGQGTVTGMIGLSPIQKSFLESPLPSKHHYNQSVLLDCRNGMTAEILAPLLDQIVRHHDALRIVYYQDSTGAWLQENLGPEQGYDLIEDWYEPQSGSNEQEWLHTRYDELQAGIELASGPLMRAGLFHTGDGDRLLLVIHHLVVDGVSWRILFEDLSSLYNQYIAGKPFKLPLKTDSFMYWQQQQALFSAGPVLAKELDYWNNIELGAYDSIPLDMPAGTNLQADTQTVSFTLDPERTTELLTRCNAVYGTEINDLLLTAAAIGLRTVFGTQKVLVSLEGHGREDIGSDADVTRTIGWFTTKYPVVLDVSGTAGAQEALVRIKEHLHRVPNKGIGYGTLRYLSPEEYRGGRVYSCEPQITFNYLGDFGSGIQSEAGEEVFSFAGGYHGNAGSDEQSRDELLTITGIVVEGRMTCSLTYSRQQYYKQTMQDLCDAVAHAIDLLLSELTRENRRYLTPVDLTYKDLSIQQLALLNRNGEVADVYPLAPLQEGLYYHWLAAPESTEYFEQMVYDIRDEALNIGALHKSYMFLLNRHPILRTYFTLDFGPALQVVESCAKDTFFYADYRETGTVDAYCLADREKGFDLGSGSQMRLAVLRTDENRYSFVWSHHHILMDGWCVGLLIQDFYRIYGTFIRGLQPELPNVYPYVNYISWLGTVNQAGSAEYWKQYLSGYESVSAIPRQAAPGDASGKHAQVRFRINAEQLQLIRRFCAAQGVTENTFIQAIWGMLLAKYNDTHDVVFGAVVSGRPGELEGVESMIGLFINTVPVRVCYKEGQSVQSLIRELQRHNIEGLPHHYVQLAEIQAAHELGNRLIDHILVFENYPVQEMLSESLSSEIGGLELLSSQVFEQTNYPLNLVVIPGSDGMEIVLSYDNGLYHDRFMSALGAHFRQLLNLALEDQLQTVSALSYITPQEQDELLTRFQGADVDYPRGETIVTLFAEQVRL
ncbi:condensation domain-containing protein, partial [Mucilaginibacter sp. SG538B]|uniref:condensation domain-containing protein n=1 Tax=Mucilaginibacter sp. SG538B TaxID=2587021 RepID=UPI0039775B9B